MGQLAGGVESEVEDHILDLSWELAEWEWSLGLP